MMLLVPPTGGDELQGVKKGIIEVSTLRSKGDSVTAPLLLRTSTFHANNDVMGACRWWTS